MREMGSRIELSSQDASLNRCNGKLEFLNGKVIDKLFLGLRQIFFRFAPKSAKYLSQMKKDLSQIFFRFAAKIWQIFGMNLIFFVHNRKFL